MKKVLVLCMIVSLIISGYSTPREVVAQNVFQAVNEISISDSFNNDSIRSQYTKSTKAFLSITSNTAYMESSIIGYSGITTSVKITMNLEKKVLWWWSVQDTWTQTFYSYSGYLQRNAPVSGGTYRIRTVFVAYSGSNSEETVEYSEIINN